MALGRPRHGTGRPRHGTGPATSWHWAGHVILSRACSVKKNAAPDEADVQRTGVVRRRLQRSRAIHRCSTQADDPFELPPAGKWAVRHRAAVGGRLRHAACNTPPHGATLRRGVRSAAHVSTRRGPAGRGGSARWKPAAAHRLHMDAPERSGKAGRIAAQHGTHVVQRPAATLQ
jgi:hypothetical protein